MPQDSDFDNFYISFIQSYVSSNNSGLTTFQQISLDQPGRNQGRSRGIYIHWLWGWSVMGQLEIFTAPQIGEQVMYD